MKVIATWVLGLRRRPEIVALLVACALLACRFLLALTLIPPWQQPDEATHVAHVELRRSLIARLDSSSDPAREAEILQSMARYDWWEHRGVGWRTPAVVPDRFTYFGTAGGKVVVEVVNISSPTAYFLIAGRLFSRFPRLTVVEDLYVLRMISALFGMLTLWVAWLAAQECLDPLGAATVASLLALHPQFAIVSTAATPDATVNLFGACLWWQAAVALKGKHVALPLVAVWVAAIAASAVDRMGVPLLAAALVVSVVGILMRVSFRKRQAAWVIPATAALFVAVLAVIRLAIDAFGGTYALEYVFSRGWAPVPGAMTLSSFMRFNWLLHQSWWFSLGWRPYLPPVWWTEFAALLTAAAALGVGRRLLTDRQIDSRMRTFMALAAIGIAIQLAAVYWTYFRLGNGAQGRYLFPFLVPSLLLFWSGIEAWIPQSCRVGAAGTLMMIFALLDAVAWNWVAIPAYYASL